MLVQTQKTQKTQGTVAIARKSLSEGIIEIRVAKSAELASLPTPQGVIKYLRFRQGVKGGGVMVYVHTEDLSLIGRVIRAKFTLFERTLPDGTKQVHVDLRPTREEATHRLFFVHDADLHTTHPNWPRFPTPQVRRVYVVIAPADAKLKVE